MDPKKESFGISVASEEKSKNIYQFTLSIVVGLIALRYNNIKELFLQALIKNRQK
jgi:hypothetical protein